MANKNKGIRVEKLNFINDDGDVVSTITSVYICNRRVDLVGKYATDAAAIAQARKMADHRKR